MAVLKFPCNRQAKSSHRLETGFLSQSPAFDVQFTDDLAERARTAASWAGKSPEQFVRDLVDATLEGGSAA